MKKFLLAGLCAVVAMGAYAENYSIVALSYDNTQLWYGDNFPTKTQFGLSDFGVDGNSSSLNGFGIQYSYGIGLGEKPMNIEVGVKWSMGFLGKSQEDYDSYGNYWYNEKTSANTQLMRLAIPVSYIYHFNVSDNFAIAPYAGLDFRFNLLGKTKYTIEETDYTGDYEKYEATANWFKKDGNEGVGEDYTWKRFQMGWHVGVRFEYSKFFLGVEYGTDFLPLWSHKWDIAGDSYKAHINTGDLAISVGMKF